MWRWVSYGLVFLLAVAFPLISPNNYYLTVVTIAFIYAIAVQGLNMIVGFLGQLSLAQAGFFGLGAYTSALLSLKLGLSFWVAMPLAALFTTAVAVVVESYFLSDPGQLLCHSYSLYRSDHQPGHRKMGRLNRGSARLNRYSCT